MEPPVGAGTLVVEGVSPSKSPPSKHGSHAPQLGGHKWGLEEGDVPPRSLGVCQCLWEVPPGRILGGPHSDVFQSTIDEKSG